MPKQIEIEAFPVTVQLSDALINYLVERPYKETAYLIESLRQSYQDEVARLTKPPTVDPPKADGKNDKQT